MIPEIVLIIGLFVLGTLAERYRQQRDEGRRWVDDIIAALEDANEDAGNARIDELMDKVEK